MVVLADEDDRQLPDRGKVQRLVERPDIGGAVAEEADGDVVVTLVLRAPRGAAGDRQMGADDGVGAHDAVLGRGQMHRAALAAHEAVVALHQLAEHLLDRDAAGERVGVAPIGAEAEVARPHGHGKAGRDRFLSERQVAGALHQVLQEQVIGALLRLPDGELGAEEVEPHLLADIVVRDEPRRLLCRRAGGGSRHCHLLGQSICGAPLFRDERTIASNRRMLSISSRSVKW